MINIPDIWFKGELEHQYKYFLASSHLLVYISNQTLFLLYVISRRWELPYKIMVEKESANKAKRELETFSVDCEKYQ